MAGAIFSSTVRRRGSVCPSHWTGGSDSSRSNGCGARAVSEAHAYLRDGAAIYEKSFAIIRAEADLAAFSAEEADVAVRMIHACGQVDAARAIAFGRGLVAAARGAIAA